MSRPEFEDLPYHIRPDLSPYLIHLTKNTKADDQHSAFDNLLSILRTGTIWGSSKKNGFIRGPNRAACLMDVPFSSLKYIINHENSAADKPRYEPFGIVVTKKYAYKEGCRPVLYLSKKEMDTLKVPPRELWRVVRFEVDDTGWIDWTHEREWRRKHHFRVPTRPFAVLVKSAGYASKLQKALDEEPDAFVSRPRSIIPLEVICQGLPYLTPR